MKIAIIGAGPRGMLTLERISSWQKQSNEKIEVEIFDPYPIGGRVWTTNQPHELIMNTAAQHITLFYDNTVESLGPIINGPSLYEWAHQQAKEYIIKNNYENIFINEITNLGPNDYSSRSLYGIYINWFYDYIKKNSSNDLAINFQQVEITDIKKSIDGFNITYNKNKTNMYADYIIMALGNLENTPTDSEINLNEFANKNNLHYFSPGFPNELNFDKIPAQENVIMRGLGLSFFDFMARFTIGRGGQFKRNSDGNLIYYPSGKEPHIIAGSRRGFPYHAKGRNEKEPGEELRPHYLTPAFINSLQSGKKVTSDELWSLIKNEIEYVYYSLLIKQQYPEINYYQFELAFLSDPKKSLHDFNIKESDLLNWNYIKNPSIDESYKKNPHKFMIDYLNKDAQDAEGGTKTNPYSSALEVLRDMRNPLRNIISNQLLTDEEHIRLFMWFNSLVNFLSIGPPAIRIEQLAALISANIVKILPPGMTVETSDDHYTTYGKFDPNQIYSANTLIEARVPSVNAKTATSKLLSNLLKNNYASLYSLSKKDDDTIKTGAIHTDLKTSQLIVNNKIINNLYFWGVPTEGQNWLTTASPRPFVNDVSLRIANDIVTDIFEKESNKKAREI